MTAPWLMLPRQHAGVSLLREPSIFGCNMTIVRYAHIACLGHAFESPACRCGPPVRIMYWVVRSEAAREAQMSLCVDGLTFTFPPLDIEGKKETPAPTLS